MIHLRGRCLKNWPKPNSSVLERDVTRETDVTRERYRKREKGEGRDMLINTYQIWHQPRNVTRIRDANYTVTSGYTTLGRTTLRLLSHFVEKAFCWSVISSNVHFVETGFRRILSTKYSMLTWPPYCICWSCDSIMWLWGYGHGRRWLIWIWLPFYKGACEWDEMVKQRFIENNWYVHNL